MQWLQTDLPAYLSAYGYGAVAALLALESLGLPIPGATVLVAAAVYAGMTGSLDIAGVVAAAAGGAVVGDNVAYWIGRTAGSGLLQRYGRYAGLGPDKLDLGTRLVRRHGGKLVFFARFLAFLRVVAMYVAGVSRMDWPRFALFDLAGSAAWALAFGLGAYLLGRQAERLTGPVSLALLGLGAVALAATLLVARRHIERLAAEPALRPAEERARPEPPSPVGR